MPIPDLIDKAKRLKELQRESLSAFKRLHLADSAMAHDGADLQVRGLFAGLRNIAIDLAAIGGSPKRATALTTALERTTLLTRSDELLASLENVGGQLSNLASQQYQAVDSTSLQVRREDGQTAKPDLLTLLNCTDHVKTALRPFTVRFTSDHADALNDQLADFIRRQEVLEKLILDVEQTGISAKTITKNCEDFLHLMKAAYQGTEEVVEEISSLRENISASSSAATEGRTSLESTLATTRELSAAIEEARGEVESHKEVVENFTKRIAAREDELATQSHRSEVFEKTLLAFKERQEALIATADNTIQEARRALAISSEVAIGRHIADQYDHERKTVHYWLIGGAISVAVALALGLWAVLMPGSNPLMAFLTRLSLVPIALAAGGFCAYQYSKQKQVVTDYAYKKVLALSLTGFREHFSDGGSSNWGELAPKLLSEIHSHPLNIRQKSASTEGGESVNTIVEKVTKAVVEKLKPDAAG